ncbi:HAD family hydrolase [Sphingobacterium sp. SGG-5]|uniref:D-glycero-alpha-D-manno-heptose-1,7-bisphosphate 7-phosphatase n=1 Tax=Sphingobacterium sp. SGG-5 TaxID=2710881 RepID=UPI0013EBB019|nr:HAD family hydrolase [Sphingobacterium sp. SGG-5]NGM61701.1 HAD family hydrolase [Sphingobacterium sp. SGG-5]
MYKAVFLDKDGTLVKDVPYNVAIEKIKFYPDIFRPLQQLCQAGYKLIVISNQSGISKGYFIESELIRAFDFLTTYLGGHAIPIIDYYYCPHAEGLKEPECTCRKPQPGLLMQAAQEHAIDLSNSWMIGDIMADVAAGNAAGCKTILLDRDQHYRTEVESTIYAHRPDYVCGDFFDVWSTIINDKN